MQTKLRPTHNDIDELCSVLRGIRMTGSVARSCARVTALDLAAAWAGESLRNLTPYQGSAREALALLRDTIYRTEADVLTDDELLRAGRHARAK